MNVCIRIRRSAQFYIMWMGSIKASAVLKLESWAQRKPRSHQTIESLSRRQELFLTVCWTYGRRGQLNKLADMFISLISGTPFVAYSLLFVVWLHWVLGFGFPPFISLSLALSPQFLPPWTDQRFLPSRWPPLSLLPSTEASTTTCPPVETRSAAATVPACLLRMAVWCATATWATRVKPATTRSTGPWVYRWPSVCWLSSSGYWSWLSSLLSSGGSKKRGTGTEICCKRLYLLSLWGDENGDVVWPLKTQLESGCG